MPRCSKTIGTNRLQQDRHELDVRISRATAASKVSRPIGQLFVKITLYMLTG